MDVASVTTMLSGYTSGQLDAHSTPIALEGAGFATQNLLTSGDAKGHQLTAGDRDSRGQDGFRDFFQDDRGGWLSLKERPNLVLAVARKLMTATPVDLTAY